MVNKILMVTALVLVLSGCVHVAKTGTGDTTTTTAPAGGAVDKDGEAMTEKAEGAVINIKDFKHTPNRLTVKPGETVTVTNLDVVGHSVTSDDGSSFDTGVLGQNKTVTFTAPLSPGEYAFHCTPHSTTMKATLVVEG